MKNTFSVLFYPKRRDSDLPDKASVYMRITVNGRRSELSINRKVNVSKWNQKAEKLSGTKEEVKDFNNYLDALRNKIYAIHQQLLRRDIKITSEAIKNSYLGIGENQMMLLEIFENHNEQMEMLIGKEYALSTVKKYKTAYKHVKNFLAYKFKLKDIPIERINHSFITNFEFYLKSVKNCNHNSTLKYIKNFKKIIIIALSNGWIDKDPFINYKARTKIVEREFLTKEEIQLMLYKKFHAPRLELVRDIFIFCCYTGFAYVDVKKLTKNNLVKGIDGEMWIMTNRTKTNTPSNIPLLPTALMILDNYKDHIDVINGDILLPVLSNQKSNAYLKEIADLCGITKNLTTHLARHTFATTVTLSNGVPIESVSKMLGHKSLRTTQHYAKILDRKVSDDMAILKSKLIHLNKNDKSYSENNN
ncbi:site-specific integrase [Aureibaculum luteum]|uniref:site-specific integrase n=1 Tax=Aureibaculum luteum TaxID=1548456 RepID=UPI000E500321|nr:site-specific integrase [Aureibaculum luteum]